MEMTAKVALPVVEIRKAADDFIVEVSPIPAHDELDTAE